MVVLLTDVYILLAKAAAEVETTLLGMSLLIGLVNTHNKPRVNFNALGMHGADSLCQYVPVGP